MKTSREQFEAEMAKLGDVVDMRCAKNGDMGYMAWDVSLAWRMWQASRETVAVAVDKIDGSRLAHVYLESTTTDKVDAYVKGWNACIDSINVK
uniref:hypothetical protein n=1 Tax=Hafnia alvei TaxID=569 RepID=UPI00266DB1B1|nr:hypothetical protein [Hafnia alvei]